MTGVLLEAGTAYPPREHVLPFVIFPFEKQEEYSNHDFRLFVCP